MDFCFPLYHFKYIVIKIGYSFKGEIYDLKKKTASLAEDPFFGLSAKGIVEIYFF